MSIAEKLTTVAENQQKVYDAGKQAEYDEFWDTYQNKGNAEGYDYAFAGVSWNSENWKPKYPIKLNGQSYLSAYTGLFCYFDRGLKKPALELPEGVIDFAHCRSISNAFANCNISKVEMNVLPREDCLADFMSQAFAGGNISAVKLKTVKMGTLEKLAYYQTFLYAYALENLSFVEGSVIGKAISFAQSSKLTSESIDNIIAVLKDLTGQTAQKITFHADVVANLSEEQMNKILGKGWNVG